MSSSGFLSADMMMMMKKKQLIYTLLTGVKKDGKDECEE